MFRADVLARTAAFLLLKDSRASYVIEGENPPQDRIQRWGRAIGQAGRKPIDLDELLRLQQIVIGDDRFVDLGLRKAGGFIGEHDRDSRTPIPDHISARAEDLPTLVDGLVAFDRDKASELDPVIAAAVLAFGFVFVHPFEDGNGRIHRYLIHHVLAARGFNPPGVVFPVSATILARIDDYRAVLETYSQCVLPLVRWRPTTEGNVEVLNDTGDYYRFFDATPQTEFLYGCVKKTVEEDLPEEADYLHRYDAFRASVEAIIEMSDRTIDLLFRMLRQNNGTLSKRAREKEFAKLTAEEVGKIEDAYAETFAAPPPLTVDRWIRKTRLAFFIIARYDNDTGQNSRTSRVTSRQTPIHERRPWISVACLSLRPEGHYSANSSTTLPRTSRRVRPTRPVR